jgi:hypothetical protein
MRERIPTEGFFGRPARSALLPNRPPEEQGRRGAAASTAPEVSKARQCRLRLALISRSTCARSSSIKGA